MNLIAGQIEPALLATFIAVADRKSVSGAAEVAAPEPAG
jgi:hypothetical protein